MDEHQSTQVSGPLGDWHEAFPFEAYKSLESTTRALLSLSSVFFAAFLAFAADQNTLRDIQLFGSQISWPHAFFLTGLILFVGCIGTCTWFLIFGAHLIREKRPSILHPTIIALFYSGMATFFAAVSSSSLSLLFL